MKKVIKYWKKDESQHYDKCVECEESLMRHSGLSIGEDLLIYNTPITHDNQIHYIHTLKAGKEGPPLVMLHGYGGSGVAFFPMLQELSTKYTVYCIDLLGMGLSSRPTFKANSTEETIDFFIESIEEWRKYNGLNSFHLLGHSFGGYLSCCYTLKHPDQVQSLLLLSPGGITERNSEEEQEYIYQIYSRASFQKRMFLKFLKFSASKQVTPHSIIRNSSFIGQYLAKKLINSKFSFDKETHEDFKNYFLNIVHLPKGSEESVHHIFHLPLPRGKKPFESILLNKIDKKVLFVFGDKDRMDHLGPKRLSELNPQKFEFKIAENSSHQLTLNAPKQTNAFIIDFIERQRLLSREEEEFEE